MERSMALLEACRSTVALENPLCYTHRYSAECTEVGWGVTGKSIRGTSDRGILVLTSLAGGAKHGYALVKDIREFSGVTLGAGSLYGILAKLEQQQLVRALPAQDRRNPYEITDAGLRFLRERLAEAVKVAEIGFARLDGAVG